jgi:hypothetical protein
VLRAAEGASCLFDPLAKLLQVGREGGFRLIGELAAAQVVRTALHTRAEIGFIHAPYGAPQLVGSRRLRGRQFACRGAQLLREMIQVIAHLLAFTDHFVDVLRGYRWRGFSGSARRIHLSHQIAHVICLLLLPGCKLVGGLGHRIETACGVLLLHAAKQVRSLAQAVGSSP